MRVNTNRNGKSETITMDRQGKWLSGDCGAITPVAGAKK